ncbi:MAG: TorF family putative porin [Opitutaceae bacterium]|nr:TorF family putative porin [Opitutaceae bacterium]
MHRPTLPVLAALALTTSVIAQETPPVEPAASEWSFTLKNTVASEYIFRGQEYGDLTYSPALSAAWRDLYAGVVGTVSENLLLGDHEIDAYVGAGRALTDNLSLDGGVVFYHYSGRNVLGTTGNDTIEPYLGLSATAGPVKVSLYYYYDLQIDDSTYELAATYSLPLDALHTSLDLTATAGYVTGDLTENLFIVDNYAYYGARAEMPFAIRDHATLTLGLSATDVTENIINTGAELTASASLAVTF